MNHDGPKVQNIILIGFMGGLYGIGAGWANMPALNPVPLPYVSCSVFAHHTVAAGYNVAI